MTYVNAKYDFCRNAPSSQFVLDAFCSGAISAYADCQYGAGRPVIPLEFSYPHRAKSEAWKAGIQTLDLIIAKCMISDKPYKSKKTFTQLRHGEH